jgi:programmed cell death protein 5
MEDDEEREEQLKAAYHKKLQQLQLEAGKKELLRKMMQPDAYSRMMNVRMSSPELYDKVVSTLAYLSQSGRMAGKISEEQLVALLAKMTERPETKIEFKKK